MDINKYYKANRRVEPKIKQDWKKKYPEFCISQLPGGGVISTSDINDGYFEYADDNYIVKDVSDSKKMDLYWAWGFVGVLFFVFLLGIFKIGLNWELLQVLLMISPITLLPAFWFFIKAYYMNRERKLIFDRQKGLIQVPGSFWNPPQLIRFTEAHIVLVLKTRFQGGIYLQLFKNKSFADRYLEGGILLPFIFSKALQSWSYWVWYMDKNRPLPPGNALDPYRERDYERRKADGFPAPLHPSYIKTPEHFTDEYHLMNEKNKIILGLYGDCLNDNYDEKVKINEEKRRKEKAEFAKKHWAYRIVVITFKFLKSLWC